MAVTIKDVSAKCGLSISTVSKAFNNYADISLETRELVQRTAREIGYYPNAIARTLKTNRSYNLGVLFQEKRGTGLTHSFFASVLDAFKSAGEKRGYDITFINHHIGWTGMTYLEHCRYRNVDGVCVVCADFYAPEVIELVDSNLPVVTIDHSFNNRSCVLSDNIGGLKLLVDAVQASRVVSGTTSRRLIHKLEKLCSNYEGSQLQRQVYVEGRPKTDSKSLLYSIDALHEAINNGKMVEFLYRKADSREKEKRTVSPWQLAWENGCYYLIAFADEKGIRHYRVDKMSGVRVLDAPRRGQEQFADLDLPAYLRKHFGMYGGPEHRVTLRCTADLEGAMRERFGATPMFLPEENGCFHFDVPICVSDQFYGWVCGFGGKIEVVAPPEVRQGMREMTARLAEQHQ